MFNENIRGLWDIFIKDYEQYFILNKELWINNLDSLKSFIDLNERQPSKIKETEIEKILSRWLAVQLANRKTKKKIMSNKDIVNIWDIFIKDYKQYFFQMKNYGLINDNH